MALRSGFSEESTIRGEESTAHDDEYRPRRSSSALLSF